MTAISGTSLLTCQSNRFIDNSANNFTITRNGDVRVTKEAPFLPTAAYSTSTIGGSGYFDGNGDWLEIASNAALQMSSSDFCVECWIYPTAMPAAGTVARFITKDTAWPSSYEWTFGINPSGQLTVEWYTTTTSSLASSSGLIAANSGWYHVAFCRSGSTISLFCNGVRVATTTISSAIQSTTSPVAIGRDLESGYTRYFTGYINDVRIVKGSSIYNPSGTTLTIPTAPLTAPINTSLLLKFTNAAVFDNAAKNDLETVGNAQISTSVKKFGTGSLAFDGSGDGLILGPSPSLNFGSAYFTLEFWVYFNTVSGTQIVLSTVNGSSNYAYEISCVNGALKHSWSSNGTSWDIVNAGGIGTVAAGTWYHVSICRNQTGGFMADLDGIPDYTWTSTASVFANSGLAIGNNMSLGTSGLNGYIDDLRITKGFPRYTTYYFTPPSAPFPDR